MPILQTANGFQIHPGDHQSAYYIHWSSWEVQSFYRGVSGCVQILRYASAIHDKLKHSLIKSGCPHKKTFSRIPNLLSYVHTVPQMSLQYSQAVAVASWCWFFWTSFRWWIQQSSASAAKRLDSTCVWSWCRTQPEHLLIGIPSIHGLLRWGTSVQFTFLWPAWSDLGSEPVYVRFWSGLLQTL